MKLRISGVIFCLCLSLLVSCATKDSEVYGKEKVLEYVDGLCPEPYELLDKELIAEKPDNMEYRFKAKNRDLYFKANSYLTPVQIDASTTIFYNRVISSDYVSVVQDLYLEEVQHTLTENELYLEDYGWMYVQSFQDLDRVVDTVCSADKLYFEETRYNPPEFLQEHPLKTIHLVWHRSREEALAHESWVNLGNIFVTGQNDPSQLYEQIGEWYAQNFVDGNIENGAGIPEKFLENRHLSQLPIVELNGVEMRYDSTDNPYGPYGLTTDDYTGCWYSDAENSYMIAIDVGYMTDRMSFPLIIREYVRALGGVYDLSVKGETYESRWTLGSDTWIMTSRFHDDQITDLRVEKNGQDLGISYISVSEDHNVRASFCAGVPVSDFCRMLDLSFTVDESGGKLILRSH